MTTPSRRRFLATVGGVVGLAGCLGGDSGSDTGDGEPATETVSTVDVDDVSGGEVPVRPRGAAALVDFFATWCAPCKPQMAELRTVAQQFPELHLLSVTRETDTEAIQRFWREYEGTWPVTSDPGLQVFERYDVTRVPTKVIVTADGSALWRHSGLAAADTIVEELPEGVR